MLDLGDPGDAHPERCGDVLLREAEMLAGLGELVPPVLGEQPACSRLDLLGGYARRVEFLFQGLPVFAGSASAWSVLFVSGVVDVELFGQRDVAAVPACPVARFAAAQEQQR